MLLDYCTKASCVSTPEVVLVVRIFQYHLPLDLKTRNNTGTSCQIEIHFSIQLSNSSYNIIYFVSKFLAVLKFSLLKTVTKFQQVSQRKTKYISD